MDRVRRHSARHLTREARNARAEFVANARRRSLELLDEAERTGLRAWKDARAWALENPAAVAASAFIAGLALYAWMDRRRRS